MPVPKRFREIYGDALADQIEAIMNKRGINSVERERQHQAAVQTDRPALQTEDSEDPFWWDR
jgi:hypothetical protein